MRNGTVNLPFGRKTAKQKRYIKNYGVGNIFEFFVPHITLGWLRKEKEMQEVFVELNKIKLKEFMADRLAVTQVNRRHQVIKVLKEFKLK